MDTCIKLSSRRRQSWLNRTMLRSKLKNWHLKSSFREVKYQLQIQSKQMLSIYLKSRLKSIKCSLWTTISRLWLLKTHWLSNSSSITRELWPLLINRVKRRLCRSQRGQMMSFSLVRDRNMWWNTLWSSKPIQTKPLISLRPTLLLTKSKSTKKELMGR